MARYLAFTMMPVCSLNAAVAGATGGVGRLLVQGLYRSGVPVRALVRNRNRAQEVLPPAVTVAQIDSFWSDECTDSLCTALKGCELLYVCISSTAFPTRSYLRGDTPRNVDVNGVRNILKCVDRSSIKRLVYVSSIGTSSARRRGPFSPFSFLNLFGVLDAKAEAEILVRRYAQANDCNASIVRLGRLIGAPHHPNQIRKESQEQMGDVRLYAGDFGSGDCSRQLAADVLVIAGQMPFNLDFSVFEAKGPKISQSELVRRVKEMHAGRASKVL